MKAEDLRACQSGGESQRTTSTPRDELVSRVCEAHRVLSNAELAIYGGRPLWQGRCGAEMRALMAALDELTISYFERSYQERR